MTNGRVPTPVPGCLRGPGWRTPICSSQRPSDSGEELAMTATNCLTFLSFLVSPIAARKRSVMSTGSSVQRSRSRHVSRACFETLDDRRLLSFSPAASFPVGTNPQDVVTADFNNDGKLDLATSNYDEATGDGSVSVLLGNGNGSFQPARPSATGPYPYSLAAGDFNADGKVD